MGFPWRTLLTFGLSQLANQKSKVGSIAGFLVDEIHIVDEVKGLSGPEKATIVVEKTIALANEAAHKAGKTITVDPAIVQAAIDANVALENHIESLLRG